MFSPLSFNYAYVWLIYPTTLGLNLVISESRGAPRHRLKVAWITAVILIPALAIPMPLLAQAYGNLFVPALLLVFGLGAMLLRQGDLVRTWPIIIPPTWLRASVTRSRAIHLRSLVCHKSSKSANEKSAQVGSLACRAVEMALFGTVWHGLGGQPFRKACSVNGLRKTEKGAGTLCEKCI